MTNEADGERSVPRWTRSHAKRIERSDASVAPVVYPPDEEMDPDLHVWDTWFLRERDGTIAEIDGYRVVFSLTAPADLLPGTRHDVATIRYFYSRDGRNWQCGGPVFADDAPFGSRQWAGSALYDDGTVYVYYTAAGTRGEDELSYTQRIAVGAGGTVETGSDELTIAGPFDHEILLEPDGTIYERESQACGMIYTFRDPWFFEDPATGETCLLFEANTPIPDPEEDDRFEGDPSHLEFNGSVGVAVSPSGDPTEWELDEPLLEGVGTNQELERPHVVVDDGRYYLFFSSHDHTFAPGLEGVDALYGFVADSLRGEYVPVNESGLVVTNPASAPFQTYSWVVYPHREELLVSSFFNYYDLRGLSLDDVAELPPAEQQRRFGGTLAPTVRLDVSGTDTRVRDVLEHGHLPLPREELPPLLSADRGSDDDGDGDERVLSSRKGEY
ncbi:glycoside hydrolase family 68 protein [Natronolimnohabitans sp. A-GB9]|uniref:glycoside hydrolase family 68 protein n=1 Tax=Natronolimnohabitans sp. A-GB9 TaxID=3069757 RepID=UPI0027B64A6D|nr:glycoside hydrolase family 68 protein [Natronolimnohabitans sp. A-GB9]MDQ2052505.1 glycoside hydrolase family 68 protein [Natronolimnohabitans sp. A-GB9]